MPYFSPTIDISAFNALTSLVNSKANTADLTSLINSVSSISNTIVMITGSASANNTNFQAQIDAINLSIIAKANTADLTAIINSLAGKANTADLTALANTISAKATQADLLALANTVNGLSTTLTNLAPMGTYTVSTLPTANANNLLRIANVTDLFGSRTSRVRCELDKGFYFWQPLSSDSSGVMAIANTDTTLFPLSSPQSIVMTGSIPLGTNRNYTLSPTGGWPGCTKQLRFTGSLLGALNILGTGLGSAIAMAVGATKSFVLDYSSGTPQWSQLT